MKRLLFLFCAFITLAQTLNAQSGFRVADKAPNFAVEMLDGDQVKLSKLRGRVVLLSFWATWCKPCLKELNEMPEKILRRFEGEKFTMIAISKGEPRITVEKKVSGLREQGIEFPVGLDPYEKISRMLGDDRLPQLILIDTRGVVRYHQTGYTPQRLDEVAEVIEKLLAD
ncbi:TlpA disulfide reductase family protein [uncultured Alistipes sp.]|jgi:peroxiredoxin|uniref:peroxiredoxin family protein n=1 Tax=uncultured Alistipes sp. TaxID=538949 RepID=UPI0025FA3966|nr:TlpA disulfide reductase family protein [uncultured Alistipes sp.]